jgi:hypothetical protein
MKYIYLILLATFCSVGMNAQNSDHADRQDRNKEMRDRINALSIAHITKELDFTTKEAEKFWPLYNQVKDERNRLERDKKSLMNKLEREFETMSESQALSYVDQMVALDQKIVATNLDYNHEEIIKVIGAKRFLKLKKAELDFRRKMIKEYRDRKRRN